MKKQRGVTLIGLIFTSAVLIALAVFGMKVAPSVIEYYTIVKNVKAIAGSGEGRGSPAEIRKAFDRRASIDDMTSLTGADLDIGKEGSNVVISFEYSKKIPVAGNVSLWIDFSGSSASGR